MRSTPHTVYVVVQSRGFYDVPRALIADARFFFSGLGLTDTLGTISSYFIAKKNEVVTMPGVGVSAKKHANLSYKATKHIERTFLTSDYH